jgi:hypothetical protein
MVGEPEQSRIQIVGSEDEMRQCPGNERKPTTTVLRRANAKIFSPEIEGRI